MKRVFRFFVKVLGAAMLGFGTIYSPKAKPDDHWSTPVNLVIEDTGGSEAAGGEPANDAGSPMTGARRPAKAPSGRLGRTRSRADSPGPQQ